MAAKLDEPQSFVSKYESGERRLDFIELIEVCRTLGSPLADAVYETLLDGMELDELYTSEGRKVYHYLFVDDYFTWWIKGRSYLCRILDTLHMGLIDEALFGYEVVERLPNIVAGWAKSAGQDSKS